MSTAEQLVSPMAGKPSTPAMPINVPRLITACYSNMPDAAIPAQRVAFGTSGHRGSAADHLRRILEEAQTIDAAALAMPTQQPAIAFRTNLKEKP